ncbi:PEP-CTERM sorting domain-containing protein [Candidatus Symbiobacter mobilis]|uniref:Ice-binding protein C-terminal domain-containing protein n=1 Tax=Candidatus Symbiobacter mobilis CR TaxID=946483 RepID=U5N7Y6_9BURK|nr:PEP-CTERM sorting domain-containing protein [Candidatus Symbiobacter mobilis]AGX87671.1 hypothetical protein Cenrod_1586 [Candidatus Symbiobacter mobilis CR]
MNTLTSLAKAALCALASSACLVGASHAAIDAGSVIKLNWTEQFGAQAAGNGMYVGSVVSGPGAGESFLSFCLEHGETFNIGAKMFVKDVTEITSSRDVLDSRTAWLFTQFSNGVDGYRVTDSSTNLSMQNAIWYLEQEFGINKLSRDAQASAWVQAATDAVESGQWTGLGNVRVINLYKNAAYTQDAQDQLYMLPTTPVPEPESYAMLLAGLGIVGAMARRRRA